MDRAVLESDPHRVLEGMAIAAYAVGAQKGYVYVRAEYPLAVKNLKTAIRQAERLGSWATISPAAASASTSIFASARELSCAAKRPPHGFHRRQTRHPRPRPPIPRRRVCGLPTLINNVETFANVAPILRHGPEWFSSIGTEKSKGTKVFALAGQWKTPASLKCHGITLREIIHEIGGGIPSRRKFKAVQTGGPPAVASPTNISIPRGLRIAGARRFHDGSGGMIVMDETSCMVDVAKYFTDFCRSESCGKCVPCRAGTEQMYGLLEKIAGAVHPSRLKLLEELCDLVRNTSPLRPRTKRAQRRAHTLRYFRHEYESHIAGQPCGTCRPKEEANCERQAPSASKLSPSMAARWGAREEQTILDVARENGIFIPTLCDLAGLTTGAPAASAGSRSRAASCSPPASTAVAEAWRSPSIPNAWPNTAALSSSCSRRAQPRVQRGAWSTATAISSSLALKLGMTHVHFPYQYPSPWTFQRALRGGSQPLHPVYPLRRVCGESKAPTPGT